MGSLATPHQSINLGALARPTAICPGPGRSRQTSRRARLCSGKPGVSRGRKATGLMSTGEVSVSRVAERTDAMTYWDGSRWVPDEPTTPSARSVAGRRLLGASTEAALITLLIFGLIAGTTLAARGGNGGNPNRGVAACQVDGNIVSTTGLPTYEVINFMVTDPSGTSGWVLGITWEGSWTLSVPDRSGATTYEFVSRTYGPNGAKYEVFSTCSTSS